MLNEFDLHARAMRQRLLDDPMEYADHTRYLEADWVTPIGYSVTAETAPKLADAVAGCEYMNRELCNQFTQVFAPARNLPFTLTRPHERLWFRCWLLTHEERFGVRFVLRQGNDEYQRLRAEVAHKQQPVRADG
jgi:hypothetical protein